VYQDIHKTCAVSISGIDSASVSVFMCKSTWKNLWIDSAESTTLLASNLWSYSV